MIKNVLVSVSDKTDLIGFVKSFADQGTRIVSTGGTAKALAESGVSIQQVSDWTGHPEVMGGRVKTLHPKIHMALLARSQEPEDFRILEENKIEAFDLVVVNLYPFEERAEIEKIDIGGPCLLRAAAKSYDRIIVVCDPKDYEWVAKKSSDISLEERRALAAKAFRHVSSYDAMISKWLEGSELGSEWSFGGRKLADLRYGENPHQKAYWFAEKGTENGLHRAKILQGKALSYNNLLDLNAAVRSVRSLASHDGPSCVAVKHLNPCGAAEAETCAEAVNLALDADPKSVFGGIVAISEAVDSSVAERLSRLFLECVVAPAFSAEALEVFKSKKNLRVLEWPDLLETCNPIDVRSIDGGVLLQDVDLGKGHWSDQWQCHGSQPDEKTKNDLLFAWKICAQLKSNAIALAQGRQSRGLGMGQVNRVDAVQQAIARAKEFHPEAKNLVLASDAFFPFPDSIDLIAEAGIQWVIQPGGSVKDDEVIARAQERKVNMVFTGQRHFNH